MLTLALIFLVIAVIAAVFAWTGVAVLTAGLAQILFVVFIFLFIISLIIGLARRPPKF